MSVEKALKTARGNQLKRGVLSALWGAAAAITLVTAACAGIESVKTYTSLPTISEHAITEAIATCTADPNERLEYQEMCINILNAGKVLTPAAGWPTLFLGAGLFGLMFSGAAGANYRETRRANTTVKRLLQEQTPR